MKREVGLVFYCKTLLQYLPLQTEENHKYYYTSLWISQPISELGISRKEASAKHYGFERTYSLSCAYFFPWIYNYYSIKQMKEKGHHHLLLPWIRSFDLFRHRRFVVVS